MATLDEKALVALVLLVAKRDTWSVTTYGNLGKKINHPPNGLGPILNRIAAWCYENKRHSLALLVIGQNGKPEIGMFRNFADQPDPITEANYERKRLELWQEDWSVIILPTTSDEISAAFVKWDKK